MSMTIWGFLGLLIVHGQRFIVYPSGFVPRPRDVREPSLFGIPHEVLELQTPDKVTIHCHLMRFSGFRESGHHRTRHTGSYPSNGRATVLMFHGNAMDHGEMIDLAIEFLSMGCNVVTVSYRGYGHSTGTPSEAGLRKDAQTVLDHVLSHDVLSSIPVVVYGQSLGGAVSIDLVYNNTDKISALIIENTFMSIPLLVKDFPQPLGSLSFLCTQRWPSSDRIQKIPKSIPVLMLGGDEDQVVPPKHMQGLWAAAKTRGSSVDDDEITEKHVGCFPHFSSKPVVKSGSDILRELDLVSGPADWRNGKDRFKLFAKRRHETTCYDPGYWPTIRSFLNDLPTSTSTTAASTSTATIS